MNLKNLTILLVERLATLVAVVGIHLGAWLQ